MRNYTVCTRPDTRRVRFPSIWTGQAREFAGKRVLFGQDIHGPFNQAFGSDIEAWKMSMQMLLSLDADILCEGHFGIYQPKNKVRDYIERYLEEYD